MVYMLKYNENTKNRHCKRDGIMMKKLPKKFKGSGITLRKKKINKQKVEGLLKKKDTIYCENGIAKIDSNHSDYSFWVED